MTTFEKKLTNALDLLTTVARNQALEEAAVIAERHYASREVAPAASRAGHSIAAAIRSAKVVEQ